MGRALSDIARRGTPLAIVAFAVGGVLLGGWYWQSYELSTVNVATIMGIVAVGWVLAFGLAGQLSLGHALFFGVGAYVSAILTTRTGLPLGVGLLLGTVAATALGAALAFPLLRVRGLFLAIATLGLAMIAENIAVAWKDATGGISGFGGIPGWDFGPFSSLDPQTSFVLLWAVLGVTWLLARAIWRSPFGTAAATAAEDESAAASLGMSVRSLRAKTFTVSTAYAGLAGGLFAHYQNFVAPSDVGIAKSIDIVIYGILGGAVAPIGGVVGAQTTDLISAQMRDIDQFRPVVFGVILVVAMMFFDDGIVGQVRRAWRAVGRLRRFPAALRAPSAAADLQPRLVVPARALPRPEPVPGSDEIVLACRDVTKRYGGVAALSRASLVVRRGEVHAVIGPNGAGKTSLLNVISGFLAPDEGAIEIFGHDAGGLPPHKLARLGVRRTFQTPHMVNRLTVLQNIAAGVYGGAHLTLADATLLRRRGRRLEREAYEIAAYWADRFGITGELDKFPSGVPAGHQRLVELARAMAGAPALLLLDEPTAGLNSEEVALFTQRLRAALADHATTTVVIDHQMAFIQEIADRVLVMDRGTPIAEGTPAEIMADERVVAAYLGPTTDEWAHGVH